MQIKNHLTIYIILTYLSISTPITVSASGTKNASLLKRFCLTSVKREMAKKEKNFNPEIAPYTCNCFQNRIKAGESFNTARLNCRIETSKKFNL